MGKSIEGKEENRRKLRERIELVRRFVADSKCFHRTAKTRQEELKRFHALVTLLEDVTDLFCDAIDFIDSKQAELDNLNKMIVESN